MKLCECGCGRPVNYAKANNKQTGRVKGEPNRVIKGHGTKSNKSIPIGNRVRKNANTIMVYQPNHFHTDSKGYVLEHRYIVERILGRILPSKNVIHHINGDHSDNRHENLVVCQDAKYHALIHKKQRDLARRKEKPQEDVM